MTIALPDEIAKLQVAPGSWPRLRERETRDGLGFEDKDAGRDHVTALLEELSALQRRLWAEDSRALLLVLQGMDTAGKDGAIRRVFSGVNPQGVRVQSFKVPSDLERDHDYLWRVHAAAPRRGEIGIFNRSHYEDVAVVRVLGIADQTRVERRYGHIRDFERLLDDEGTRVVKVFLHISREEQRERLQARLDDPDKRWKFSTGDLDMRRRWDEMQDAYEDAIHETSTRHAPWYVVPADRKWARDVAVASLLVATLRHMDPQPPDPDPALEGVVVD